MSLNHPTRPRPARVKWPLLLVAGLVLAGGSGALWWVASRWWQPTAPPSPPDPRLTFATPFQNVRPDVKYVGDQACVKCHDTIVESYKRHPMGRSFAPVSLWADEDRYDAAVHNPFSWRNNRFEIRREGDKVFHAAERQTDDGKTLFKTETEVAYAMGSGTRGRSYLLEKDGWLFQSPISWYSQKQIWDHSPGFKEDRLFDRPIPAGCLFCHANDAAPVPDTINQYKRPIFRQHAIGCERCHGPGERHVAFRETGQGVDGFDPTIVNPKHLEPSLREGVCQQCHLQGQTQVERRGRNMFDYRPGLPLHLFLAMYVRNPKLIEGQKAVGHVEQMYDSRCFQKSQGKMGCATCHDPHSVPEESKKTAFFRDRCLTCHGGDNGCSLTPPERQKTQANDSCYACHMPRVASSDIVHTAVTDHRVPRKGAASPAKGKPPGLEPGELPILHFHQALIGPNDLEAERDLGVALSKVIQENPKYGSLVAPLAQPRLEAAVARDPRDAASREGLALTLWAQDRKEDAFKLNEALLRDNPRRESTLLDACVLAYELRQGDQALGYARRLVEVNPWNAGCHQLLARALASQGQWAETEQACREALKLSPAKTDSRQLLIRSLIKLGQRARAEEELEVLVQLDPAHGGDLRRWFAELY